MDGGSDGLKGGIFFFFSNKKEAERVKKNRDLARMDDYDNLFPVLVFCCQQP